MAKKTNPWGNSRKDTRVDQLFRNYGCNTYAYGFILAFADQLILKKVPARLHRYLIKYFIQAS